MNILILIMILDLKHSDPPTVKRAMIVEVQLLSSNFGQPFVAADLQGHV